MRLTDEMMSERYARLTVSFAKGAFQYFIIKVDHGTGHFDKEYVAHGSPFIDPHEVPQDEAKVWKVQVIGFVKDDPQGYTGDIIDVAAKAYVAEHAEGVN